MKFAYADPPYLGCCGRYQHHHPDGRCWDDVATHVALFERLQGEYPDGWAVSCSTPSLRHLLPATPADTRIAAWVKPFAVFKVGVNPAYAWEPVLFRGGRKRDRTADTVRDWHSESITLKRGLVGAKPKGFGYWVAELLGAVGGKDELHDLYPGTGGVRESWMQGRLIMSYLTEGEERRPHDWNVVIPGGMAGYGMAKCLRCGELRETAGEWRTGYCEEQSGVLGKEEA